MQKYYSQKNDKKAHYISKALKVCVFSESLLIFYDQEVFLQYVCNIFSIRL